jgi:hypothetical protein
VYIYMHIFACIRITNVCVFILLYTYILFATADIRYRYTCSM